MRRIEANGTRHAVLIEGTGRPIVFVHGFPLDHSMWKHQVSGLKGEATVIAPDLRGFGQSEATAGVVSMEQFADDIAALLDSADIVEPVVFCGLSMGGYVAWQFVRKYPERLRGLILCDTRAIADTKEGIEARRKLAQGVLEHGAEMAAKGMLGKLCSPTTVEERPDVLSDLRRVMLRTRPEGIAAALHGMAARPDMTAMLGLIRVPTLVIVGESDAISPPDEMRGIADAIPRSRFVEIAGAGHMAPLEQPDAVNEAIREFLRSLAG